MENKSPRFVAKCARRACILEASAEKPGNVTPTRSFGDLSYGDLVKAAERLEPVAERSARAGDGAGVGQLIYDATSGEKNANFGIIMLLVPLAAVSGGSTGRLLGSLTWRETVWLIKAMRREGLGGMELKDESLSRYDVLSEGIFDVVEREKLTPLELMRRARRFDALAREWLRDYPVSRGIGERIEPEEESIISEYLRVLSERPDTLIARKAGVEEAERVSRMAGEVLNGDKSAGELDSYLRADGNARNPGATADLIAAGLFLRLLRG